MKLALILLLAPLLPAQIFSPPGAVRRYAGTPTAGDCTASAIGRRAVDYSAIPSAHYKCSQASSGVYEWEAEGSGGGGTGDVGGGSGLTTAGAGVYVSSSSTLAQDASWTRVAAGQYKLYNTTGPNTLTVQAGSAQSTTNLLSILNSGGTSIGAIRSDGSGDFASLYFGGTQVASGAGSAIVTNGAFYVSSNVRVVSGGCYVWTNNAGAPHVGTADLAVCRNAANSLAITNGSSTNYALIGAGGLQFGTDNTYPIGAVSSGRPSALFVAGAGTFGGKITLGSAGTSSGDVVTIDGTQTLTNKSIAATQLTGTVATARLGSGTADSTTYLRGDQTWATVSGGATASSSLTDFVLTRNSGTLATLAAGKYAYGNGPLLTHAGSTFSPVTLTVTGTTGNGVTPIVVTVSSLTGTSLQQGHTVHITGVGGNTAANGTHVVEVLDATHISLTGKTGNGTYTSGGVVAGTGSGTCPVYGTPQGYAQIDCPASTGLIMSCTGSCTMRQSPTSTIADDGTYFGDLVVVGGAWSSATDQRGWLNRGGAIQAGQGISTSVSGGTTTVNVDGTVARTTGNNSYTGANNFTLATRTAPHRASTGSPASRDNCTVGDTYFQTDATAGQNQWGCTATNTWTLQGGGGSSAPTPTSTTYLVDEFFQGGSSTAWGQLGWRGVATAGSGTTAAVAGTANHPGALRLTTSAASGDGLAIDLRGGSVNPIVALNGSGGVGYSMTAVFKTSSDVANERIEIGWFDAQADGANNMIGINFIPAVSHTKFQCTVMVSGTRTYVDSGVTPANSTWYAAKLNINSSGVLTCDINGTTSTTSATFPTSAMAPAIWIQNSTAAAQTLDVDWVAMAIPNGGR